MMGQQSGGQKPLFYSFNLDDHMSISTHVPRLPVGHSWGFLEAGVGIEPAWTALQAAAYGCNSITYERLTPRLPSASRRLRAQLLERDLGRFSRD